MTDAARQFTVAPDDDGIRLDRWCKRHLPEVSFTTVAKWARTGQIRIDGARAAPGDRVEAGQQLRLPPPEPARAAERARGVRRVDFLMHATRFAGLSVVAGGAPIAGKALGDVWAVHVAYP